MKFPREKIDTSFFLQNDVVNISKQLLGKFLVTNINGKLTSGIITETEAYKGPEDKASHAYNNKKTNRTEVMFQRGGIAYVYLCYGIHHLFNIVTNKANIPHAVLIRAIQPVDGIKIMLKRRKKLNVINNKVNSRLASGPGTLSQALGISTSHSGEDLINGNEIWLEDRDIDIAKNNVIASPRVGIGYAEEDALLPWRFRIKAIESLLLEHSF